VPKGGYGEVRSWLFFVVLPVASRGASCSLAFVIVP